MNETSHEENTGLVLWASENHLCSEFSLMSNEESSFKSDSGSESNSSEEKTKTCILGGGADPVAR